MVEITPAHRKADDCPEIRKELPRRRRRASLGDAIENPMHVPPMQLGKLKTTNDRQNVEPQPALDLAGAPKAASMYGEVRRR